jgi:hypothetical protein
MSQFEQDPSASTGRFRAFVERGDDEAPRSRRAPRSRVSPAMLIVAIVVVVAIIAAIVAVA